MIVYGVVYASMFDEKNVFLHEADAGKLVKLLRRRHKLKKNDLMLRVIPIEIHESYNPNLYAPKKINLEKPVEESKNV